MRQIHLLRPLARRNLDLCRPVVVLEALQTMTEGYEREPSEQCTSDILIAALSEQLSESEIQALAAEGALLSEDQAIAEALAVI